MLADVGHSNRRGHASAYDAENEAICSHCFYIVYILYMHCIYALLYFKEGFNIKREQTLSQLTYDFPSFD